MSAVDLRRLVAENNIRDRLTETEANILRMAAKNKSAQGIASLYGFPDAGAAQRAVEKIVEKLEGSAPDINLNAAGAGPTPPRPAPAAVRSPRRSGPPAGQVLLAYLREHGETRQAEAYAACGIKAGSVGDSLARMERNGEVISRKEGRAKFLRAGGKTGQAALKVTTEPAHAEAPPRRVRTATFGAPAEVRAAIDVPALLDLLLRRFGEWRDEQIREYLHALNRLDELVGHEPPDA